MTKAKSVLTSVARFLYELGLSLYLSFNIVDREVGRSSVLDWIAAPIVAFDRLLSHWRNGFSLFLGGYYSNLAFTLTLTGFLALILFFGLRLLCRAQSVRVLLDYAMAAVIAIVPLFTSVYEGSHLQAYGEYEYTSEGHLHVLTALQYTEVATVLVLVCFGLYRRWATQIPTFLLLGHFVFWGLILYGRDWWQGWHSLLVYWLLPLTTSLLWIYCRVSMAAPPKNSFQKPAG